VNLGPEHTLHQTRVLREHEGDDANYGLLVVDWTNGFSSANRQTISEETERVAPQILRWTNWALTQPFQMVMKPQCSLQGFAQPTVIQATKGMSQGDPLNGFWFGINEQPVIDRIHENWKDEMDVYRWLIDDGMFAAPLPVLDEILRLCMEDPEVERRDYTYNRPNANGIHWRGRRNTWSLR